MKIRAILLLVVLLLGVSAAVFTVQPSYVLAADIGGDGSVVPPTQGMPGAPGFTPPSAATSAATPGAANPTPGITGTCSSVTGSLACVMSAIMSIFAWFVGVAAILLEFSVYYTVVTMGTYVHGLAAIPVVWATLRDIGNIVLIFGFIAIGIETIIGSSYYGNAGKRLPMLLIVAVLLNFSLFFTEAIIDVGNLFATQFYSQINGGGNSIPKPSEILAGGVHNEGISNAIMSRVGLQSLYGAAVTPNSKVLLDDSPIYVGLLGIILFIITAFVLLSLAFILVVRFITLIFLIIVAPVGFAGLIVPKLEQYARQWWSTLINQTLTAPVLMLMLYVALKVILDNNFLAGFGGGANAANGYAGIVNNDFSSFGSTTLSFIVAMGLLLGVVVLAKKMSAAGAGAATSLASKLSIGLAGSAVFGGAGMIGRQTIGRGSSSLNQRLMKSSFGRTAAGRTLSKTFTSAANASYDARNTNAISKGAAALQKQTGISALGFGAGSKASFAKGQKEAVDAHVKYSKDLKQTDEEKAQQKMFETMGEAEKQNARFDDDALRARHVEESDKMEKAQQSDRNAAEDAQIALKRKQETIDALKEDVKAGKATTAEVQKAQEEYDVQYAKARTAAQEAQSRSRVATREMQERHKEQRSALEVSNKETLAETQKAIAEAKNAPLSEYADNLEGQWYLRGAPDAAKKIRDDLNKKQSEKDRERLQKIFESTVSDDEKPKDADKDKK